MRSRFSAFVTNNAGYLGYSWAAATCPEEFINPDPTWRSEVKFTRLEILDTAQGSPFDTTGMVHFRAHWTDPNVASGTDGASGFMEERSRFIRENGRWVYLIGDVLN